MLIQLSERPADPELEAVAPFQVNAPGLTVRTRRSAILPQSSYAPARPLRLDHIPVFSPGVPQSVAFMTDALGMGLADRAQDIIAFCCARKDSDHHVVAFAKSPSIGFHHASFMVGDPDVVGRGGRTLLARSKRGDCGFGRHTIGSNFCHYIQDPWGSWFEYYSDMAISTIARCEPRPTTRSRTVWRVGGPKFRPISSTITKSIRPPLAPPAASRSTPDRTTREAWVSLS